MQRLLQTIPRCVPVHVLAFTAIALLFAISDAHAQTTGEKDVKDPFGIDIIDRASASTPLTYGIIGAFSYPAFQRAATDLAEPVKFSKFEAQVYFDAWQFGFARRIYGDVFQFTARTVGRDVYSGWFVEYGSADLGAVPVQSQNGEIMEPRTATVYAVGMRAQSGYKNKLSFIYLSNFSFGARLGDQDDNKDGIFVGYSLGAGGRMPLPFGAVQVNALGDLVMLPEGDEPVMILSISVGATLALNLQAD